LKADGDTFHDAVWSAELNTYLDGWRFVWHGDLHGPFGTRQEADSALDTALREAGD
jgi:hypothetical protein